MQMFAIKLRAIERKTRPGSGANRAGIHRRQDQVGATRFVRNQSRPSDGEGARSRSWYVAV